jgi:hypothetical protein
MAEPASFWPQTIVDWAQIASAVGTCGAVIVALWLAQRKPKAELLVSALLSSNRAGRFLNIKIVNKSPQEATIESIAWYLDGHNWFRYHGPVGDIEHPSLPSTIKYGDHLPIQLHIGGRRDCLEIFKSNIQLLKEVPTKKILRKLRFRIKTTLNESICGTIDEEFLDLLWNTLCELRDSQ